MEGLKPAQDPEFDPQGLEVSLKGFKQGSDEGLPHCRKITRVAILRRDSRCAEKELGCKLYKDKDHILLFGIYVQHRG